MRRYVLPILALFLLVAQQVQAATIHMHFFESSDVVLDNEQFQLYSVFAEQGSLLTVVAYGMEEGIAPGLTLLDPNGSTLRESLNASQGNVVYVQIGVPQTGMYTYIVSRQSATGGLVRVMVFEGEPLNDITLIDTLDPFAPSRAFMLATDPQEPVDVSIDVIEPEDETVVVPEVFSSRATASELPPLEERITPLPEGFYAWQNNAQTPFYTINVRPFPEVLATSSKINGRFDLAAQGTEINDYLLCVGACKEPERVDREYCIINGVEYVAKDNNSNALLAVDPNSTSGGRAVTGIRTDGVPGCADLPSVELDLPTTSSGGGGGNLFGLPPSGDGPPADGPGVDLFDPTPPPPTDGYSFTYPLPLVRTEQNQRVVMASGTLLISLMIGMKLLSSRKRRAE